MYKNDNINYDNVKPFNRIIGTKKVIFNDQSDIIHEVNLVSPDLTSITIQLDNYSSVVDSYPSLNLRVKDYQNC